MAEPVLRGAGLHHSYGASEVLRGVDLEIAAGETVALMGQLPGGVHQPQSGEQGRYRQRPDRHESPAST